MSKQRLKAPFPYFGGKSAVAAEVWRRFGNVTNYVEPFFGSGAVLLGRPQPFKGVETVNDADGLLANFWRAMTKYPRAVARWADWPVSEADLHARHLWLVGRRAGLTSRLMADPEWCDPKAAGWWVWGVSCWIGSGWCSGRGPWVSEGGEFVNSGAGQGVNRQLPHLGNAGQGVWPHLGAVAERMRRVRVACGDWSRVVTNSVLRFGGCDSTAVFLDPPYVDDGWCGGLYTGGEGDVAHDAHEWARGEAHNGTRIAICGYAGGCGHESLEADGWVRWAWKAAGGYGSQADGAGRENARRECIWFSPSCINEPEQPALF